MQQDDLSNTSTEVSPDEIVLLHSISSSPFHFDTLKGEKLTLGPKKITRKEATERWKQGHLVGVFNIPFSQENLFNACKDFAVQGIPDCYQIELIFREENVPGKILEENNELRSKNSNLQEMNQQLILKLKSSREEITKLNSRLLLKEEENQSDQVEHLKKIDKQAKQIAELQKKIKLQMQQIDALKEHHEHEMKQQQEEQKKDLQKQLQSLRNSFEQAKNEEKDRLSFEYDMRLKKEKLASMQELRKENQEIQTELDRSRNLVRELVGQNRDLSDKLKEVGCNRRKTRGSNITILEKDEKFS
jgi:hypothetical protein